MKTMPDDEGLRAVRDVRAKISAECLNDPRRLVEHYVVEQGRYRDRLLRPVAAARGEAEDGGSRRH